MGGKSFLNNTLPYSIIPRPEQVVVDAKGNIYVSTEETSKYLYKFDKQGNFLYIMDKIGPVTNKYVWSYLLNRTVDGGIEIVLVKSKNGKHKKTYHEQLFFDENMNYLCMDCGFPDGKGKRYKTDKITHNAIANGKAYKEYILDVYDSKTKETSKLKVPVTEKGKIGINKKRWRCSMVFVDYDSNMYFFDMITWVVSIINQKFERIKEFSAYSNKGLSTIRRETLEHYNRKGNMIAMLIDNKYVKIVEVLINGESSETDKTKTKIEK